MMTGFTWSKLSSIPWKRMEDDPEVTAEAPCCLCDVGMEGTRADKAQDLAGSSAGEKTCGAESEDLREGGPHGNIETSDADGAAERAGDVRMKRKAVLRVVMSASNPNKGLRYWSCANQQLKFWKRPKRQVNKESGKATREEGIGEPHCDFFEWLDPPRVTKEQKKEQLKEKRRKRELALLA